MKYIHQNRLFEVNELTENSGYKLGSDITDLDSFVKLSDKQNTFLDANPTASIFEIWNLKLNEVVPMPELSVSEKRINAFKYEKGITFKGVSLSVDEAVVTMQSYSVEGKVELVTELQTLIVAAKDEIRTRII